MALFRQYDQSKRTVQFLYKGSPVTPEMNVDDAPALLEGLGQALNTAYNKLRDARVNED